MKIITVDKCENCPYFEYGYTIDKYPFVCQHIDIGRKGIDDCEIIQEYCPLKDKEVK